MQAALVTGIDLKVMVTVMILGLTVTVMLTDTVIVRIRPPGPTQRFIS